MTATVRYYPGSEVGGARPSLSLKPYDDAGSGFAAIETWLAANWATTDTYNTIFIEEPAAGANLVLSGGSGTITAATLEHHLRNGMNGYDVYRGYLEEAFARIHASGYATDSNGDTTVDLIVVWFDSNFLLPNLTFNSIDVNDVLDTIYGSATWEADGLPRLDVSVLTLANAYSTRANMLTTYLYESWLKERCAVKWSSVIGASARDVFGRQVKICAFDFAKWANQPCQIYDEATDILDLGSSIYGRMHWQALISDDGQGATPGYAAAVSCLDLRQKTPDWADDVDVINAAYNVSTEYDFIPIFAADARVGTGTYWHSTGGTGTHTGVLEASPPFGITDVIEY